MGTYDIRLQAAIDAASVAKDAGDTDDLRDILVTELEQRGVETTDEGWLHRVVEGIKADPNFMTTDEPEDYVPEERSTDNVS